MINKTHTQGSEKFITCLHKVALHHSKIVEQFATKVLFLLPKVGLLFFHQSDCEVIM